MSEPQPPGRGTSPPVRGEPPFDPSQNVYNLVDAGLRRQDDLRNQDRAHAREMRETARMYEGRLDAKDQRIDAMFELIRRAEAQRIDAILKENATNVQRAAEVQAAQQQALAAQVLASAEALRTQVANTAATTAETLRTTVAPMLTRLDELSRAQYETQGQKQQVVETREVRGESRLNQGQLIALMLLLTTIIGLILLYATKK